MSVRKVLSLPSAVTTSWMTPITIACVVAVLGLCLNPYLLFLLSRIVIFVLLIIGLNVLMGYSGQLSFAHAALFGVGAYVTGLLQVHLGVPFVVAISVATVAVAGFGTLLVLPALRLSGIHLAIATLAIAQAIHWVLINWTSVTFGAGGFRAPTISLVGLDTTQTVFLVALSLTTICYLLVRQLTRTSFGRRFVAGPGQPGSAPANGGKITRVENAGFAFSAAIAGLAGGLYSVLLGFVAPESFNLEQMILMKIMTVVGGLGTMLGSVIGPTLVIVLQEQLRESQGWLEVIFGTTLILFVLFLPKGIGPLVLRIFGQGPQVETLEIGNAKGQVNAQVTT